MSQIRTLSLLACAALVICFTLTAYTTAWSADVWEDKTNGFSITFPKGWKAQKSTNKPFVAMAMSPDLGKSDPYKESVQVAVVKVGDKMNWDQFAKKFAGGFKSLPESKFAKGVFGKLKIDGLDVRRFGGTFKIKNTTMAYLAYATAKNGKGYAIVCYTVPSEFNKYKQLFENTAKTLKIN